MKCDILLAMKKLAIFDMDGTILNTIEDLADSVNYCLKEYGFPTRSLEEITSFVGNGIHRLIELAVPEGTDEKTVDEVFKLMLSYYKDHCTIKTRPYDGIERTISELRTMGIKTAVVSNKADSAVKSLCIDYFDGLFDYSVGDKPGQNRKPAPDSVNAVLEYFGISKEDAVYIGDSEVDLATARNAKLDVIMVGWGFREEKFILEQGAEFVIHEPGEIIELIK